MANNEDTPMTEQTAAHILAAMQAAAPHVVEAELAKQSRENREAAHQAIHEARKNR